MIYTQSASSYLQEHQIKQVNIFWVVPVEKVLLYFNPLHIVLTHGVKAQNSNVGPAREQRFSSFSLPLCERQCSSLDWRGSAVGSSQNKVLVQQEPAAGLLLRSDPPLQQDHVGPAARLGLMASDDPPCLSCRRGRTCFYLKTNDSLCHSDSTHLGCGAAAAEQPGCCWWTWWQTDALTRLPAFKEDSAAHAHTGGSLSQMLCFKKITSCAH